MEVPLPLSFHPYLEGEDGGEEGVADLEGEGDDARLVVVLDAHRDHVQEDQHEDGDLEPAVVEEMAMTSGESGYSREFTQPPL